VLREESRAVHGELLSLLSMRGGGSTAAKGEEEAARQLATTTRYGQGSKQGGTGGGEREAERDAEWGARGWQSLLETSGLRSKLALRKAQDCRRDSRLVLLHSHSWAVYGAVPQGHKGPRPQLR